MLQQNKPSRVLLHISFSPAVHFLNRNSNNFNKKYVVWKWLFFLSFFLFYSISFPFTPCIHYFVSLLLFSPTFFLFFVSILFIFLPWNMINSTFALHERMLYIIWISHDKNGNSSEHFASMYIVQTRWKLNWKQIFPIWSQKKIRNDRRSKWRTQQPSNMKRLPKFSSYFHELLWMFAWILLLFLLVRQLLKWAWNGVSDIQLFLYL